MTDAQRHPTARGHLPSAFLAPGSSSFTDFLDTHAAHLLPGRRPLPPGSAPEAPHATTIVALAFDGGVVMGGDRRATMGNLIAHREIEKVFPADDYSCVGIAGSAGVAIELVRLFQVELEHYEKIEGALMSLEGKANRLATMIRSNLPMAMQGLAVVPMFAGYDLDGDRGRIFSYDVTGGRYEERDHHSVGSGSLFARGSLKKRWRPGLGAGEGEGAGDRLQQPSSEREYERVVVECLPVVEPHRLLLPVEFDERPLAQLRPRRCDESVEREPAHLIHPKRLRHRQRLVDELALG